MDLILSGIGKIAKDQHVPALAASQDWTLVATHSRSGRVDGVDAFQDLTTALEQKPKVEVWSLCQPPGPRFELAKTLLQAGKHVMLEKPPGATVTEAVNLVNLARQQNVTLFMTWHSQMAKAVSTAADWLLDKRITSARITWHEDVRAWHPGQDWVFESGGFGVFDPGINALSIMTRLMPGKLRVLSAQLKVPANRAMPIAAEIAFADNISASLDWRKEGPPSWDIEVITDAGTLLLRNGGADLFINGDEQPCDGPEEYPALYAQMADLVRQGQSDTLLDPLYLVADAFTLGERHTVEAFDF